MDVNKELQAVAYASQDLVLIDDATINKILYALADRIDRCTDEILSANAIDLQAMDPADPKYDRLKLTEERLNGIASDIRNVAMLPSPLNRVMEETVRPNGLLIKKISVPFGVIGIIYEARPNVTFDVFSLCFKSGNACVLKGGHEADCSNKAIMALIHQVLSEFNVNTHIAVLLPSDRQTTEMLLHARGMVDVIIPRGSSRLITYVRQEATVPVIETGAGICHAYFDALGDAVKGAAIIDNAKTRRVSVCNALDCLLVHKIRLSDLPVLCKPLEKSNVVLYGDGLAYDALASSYPTGLLEHATSESYGTEFLDYKMAIRTVDSIEEAIAHISQYGSKHSECIITEDRETATFFTRRVDAACVYANAPTSFTDGAQFGLGAEIGISTQKLHARGPMGLREMTTYKWVIEGNGQIRR